MLQLHAAIMDHPDAWPFLEAVDGREVTDYYEIIKDPVDLAMLKRRLVSPASPKLSGRCRCRRAEEASWGVSQERIVTSVLEAVFVRAAPLRPGTLRFSSASIPTSSCRSKSVCSERRPSCRVRVV